MSEPKRENITLGSGFLYCTLFTGTLPEVEAIEREENRLGHIKNGAELTYTPTFYEVKDDNGEISEPFITEEEATLKSGVLTWSGNTLALLCNTARVTEEAGKRIVKIGGVENDNGNKYALLFVHKSKRKRVLIVGSNQNGFTLSFAKDAETVVDAEFRAHAQDGEGTLIQLIENIPVTTLTVTSAAGSASGKTVLTVTPVKAASNTYKYKTAATVTEPVIGGTVTGYTEWDGTSEITAATGNQIVVAELDENSKVVRFGKATVTSKA